jgi:hypothetical protein
VDVRVNQVTTDINVTDSSAMLTPEVMSQIVAAVIQRLEEHQREQQRMEEEQSFGSPRRRGPGS